MLLKNVSKSIKSWVSVVLVCACGISISYADGISCKDKSSQLFAKKLCQKDLKELREEFNEVHQTALLITDAPTKLIEDTHQLWSKRAQLCKNNRCLQHQFNMRIEDLNFYTSMNQSLTQHYIKFEHGKIAPQPVHLKIHQLTKDRIKIEGIAYRDPNNRPETQGIPLLAYTTSDQKQQIIDNENDCKYQIRYDKSLVKISTTQKGCDRFTGIFRLYD